MGARMRTRALLDRAWVALAVLLMLLTLLSLVSSISEANSSATYASRDPGVLIAIALISVAVGLGSLYSAVGVARGRPRRAGRRGGAGLTVLTGMLILLYMLAGLATGPQ